VFHSSLSQPAHLDEMVVSCIPQIRAVSEADSGLVRYQTFISGFSRLTTKTRVDVKCVRGDVIYARGASNLQSASRIV
jgi:hypothetical protein